METQTSVKNWYHNLMTGLETTLEALQIEGEERLALREFVVKMAREQYAAGNKNGIRWLKMQLNKPTQAAS